MMANMRRWRSLLIAGCLAGLGGVSIFTDSCRAAERLRVGVAAIEIPADDTMDMAGGIHPWKASGAEAPLRATARILGHLLRDEYSQSAPGPRHWAGQRERPGW